MSELSEIELRESAEMFFKLDDWVYEAPYIKDFHPIYIEVLHRRLKELGIPRKREIFATKWARIASMSMK